MVSGSIGPKMFVDEEDQLNRKRHLWTRFGDAPEIWALYQTASIECRKLYRSIHRRIKEGRGLAVKKRCAIITCTPDKMQNGSVPGRGGKEKSCDCQSGVMRVICDLVKAVPES